MESQRSYESAQRSYEYFCQVHEQPAFPAQLHTLGEWVTGRGIGSLMPWQDRIKPETILSYLSALRSVHVDRRIATDVFDSDWLARIVNGIRRHQPQRLKKQASPITKEILEKLVEAPTTYQAGSPEFINNANFIVVAKVAFAGFLRSGEFTYDLSDLQDLRTFQQTKLLRLDITFGDLDDYAIISLKRSKTDYNHEGVEIVVAATGRSTCPVQALRHLFAIDPQPPNAPLFRLTTSLFSSFIDTNSTELHASLRPSQSRLLPWTQLPERGSTDCFKQRHARQRYPGTWTLVFQCLPALLSKRD
jgi:hypothetical protein